MVIFIIAINFGSSWRLVQRLLPKSMAVHFNAFHKKDYIYVAKASYGIKDYINVLRVLVSGYFNEGKWSDIFKKKFSKYTGLKHIAVTNSGSSANLLAVACLTSTTLGSRALKAGDEFITTPLCFPTTITPALIYGLIPKFVDVKGLNIDVDKIEEQITLKTKLIVFAHALGIPANMDKIMSIAKKYNLWVITDCCDALGSTYKGKSIHGDISTFSFYPAHHISMVEGGAIGTNNGILSNLIRKFRDWGRECWCKPGVDNTCRKRFGWKLGKLPQGYDHKYIYSEIGYNLKPTDFQCAIGAAQIDKIDTFVKKRQENYLKLYNCFKQYDKFVQPFPLNKDASYFGFPFIVKNGKRLELVKLFEESGIGTRPIFAGNITKHPMYRGKPEDFTNCDYIMENGVWIGCHPQMTDKNIMWINEVLDYFSFLYG